MKAAGREKSRAEDREPDDAKREIEWEWKASKIKDSLQTVIIHTNIHKDTAGLAVMTNFPSPDV